MSEESIRIRMLKTVLPDLPFFLTKKGTVLLSGRTYNAASNRVGAICGICENGELLGVKPGEFEFVEAPDWLLSIHRQVSNALDFTVT